MKTRCLLAISTFFFALFAIGCGQSQFQPQPPSPTPSALPVTIEPQSVVMKHGDRWNFAVGNVSGAASVNWSIQEGSAGGAISSDGVYTAPAIDGVYHVMATSKADPSKSATATVSVGGHGFALTSSLGTPRYLHTATLLPNGMVYVAGGDTQLDYDVALADRAELFDPAMGAFEPTGKVARELHAATLLQNGDVLFTGGITGESPSGIVLTGTAELLKAGSTSLQPTGNMGFQRCGHKATLLPDGRVLITGGSTQSGTKIAATQSAEIYDPASGTFMPVGNMRAARQSHSATLLLTGKVLVTGGGSADAELFDPATNSFTPAGSTSSPGSMTTLLADGRVLITDGSTAQSQLYDPVAGQFTSTGAMGTSRSNYTATLLPDGTVLIAGGYIPVGTSTPGTSSLVPVTSAEIYNLATGSFTPGPTMRQGRHGHTATLLPDGSVLFVGGIGPCCSLSTPLASAEIYR